MARILFAALQTLQLSFIALFRHVSQSGTCTEKQMFGNFH